MELRYSRNGDYLVPDLTLPERLHISSVSTGVCVNDILRSIARLYTHRGRLVERTSSILPQRYFDYSVILF